MNGIVRSHGLNPYLGLLHDGEEDYETLVYDMVEPFRPFVDRMIIRMINRKELRAASFGDGEPQFRLNREAIQSVVRAFEETMRESMSHSTISDVMLAQVRSLRKLVLGEGPFWLFRWMLRSETKEGDALIAYNKGQ